MPAHSLSSISDTNTKENINSNINSNSHVKDFKDTNKYPLDNVEDFDDVINGELDGSPTTIPTLENPLKNSTELGDGEVEKVTRKETDIADETVIMSIPNRTKSSEELESEKENPLMTSTTTTTGKPVIEMESLGEYSNQNDTEIEKASFTLENVHKEDELIRAESEHRTRKSKELSAEYRQSRVLNTTEDKAKQNKSLEGKFNIDEPEGNISSEALSIQVGLYISYCRITNNTFLF